MGARRKAHDSVRRGRPTKPGSRATLGADPAPRSRPKILFVTSEFADYVKVGGLGEVSAALPRTLRNKCDMRVLLPGYRDVVSQLQAVEIVGRLPSCGDIPACDLARSTTGDLLPVYVLLCPQLFERDGGLYGDATGADWKEMISVLRGWASPPHKSHPAQAIQTGNRTCCISTTGPRRWRPPISPGAADRHRAC